MKCLKIIQKYSETTLKNVRKILWYIEMHKVCDQQKQELKNGSKSRRNIENPDMKENNQQAKESYKIKESIQNFSPEKV